MASRRTLAFFRAFVLLCLSLSPLQAQSAETDGTDGLMRQNFRGWAGIVLLCEYQEPDVLLDRVCNNASREAVAAARNLGVSLTVAPSNGAAIVAALTENRITLHLRLFATSDRAPSVARAVMSSISFRVFYNNAVELKPAEGPRGALPRLGFLNMYSVDGVAMGTRGELAGLVGDTVRPQLREAVATFAKYSAQPTK